MNVCGLNGGGGEGCSLRICLQGLLKLSLPWEALGEVAGETPERRTCNFASSRASVPMLVELRVAMRSSTWKGRVVMVKDKGKTRATRGT